MAHAAKVIGSPIGKTGPGFGPTSAPQRGQTQRPLTAPVWRRAARPIATAALIRAIAYQLQEKALGGLKPATRRLLASVADASTARRTVQVPAERKIKRSAGSERLLFILRSREYCSLMDPRPLRKGDRVLLHTMGTDFPNPDIPAVIFNIGKRVGHDGADTMIYVQLKSGKRTVFRALNVSPAN